MPPDDLEVTRLHVGTDEYALFSFPLPAPALPATLTAAERCVARSLIHGARPADIARERGTSVNTVQNQIRSIYAKLDVHSIEELVVRCR